MPFLARFGLAMALFAIGAATVRGDDAAVKQMIKDYAKAFNSQQLENVMSFWNQTGVHIDRDTGERTEGREAIKRDIAEVFEQQPGTRIAGRVERVRMIQPDVASVKGQVSVSTPDLSPTLSDFSAILTKQDGKWTIAEIEEAAVPSPTSPYEALQELEWLVGTWVDSGEESRVDNVFRWSPSQTFLLRSFVVQTGADDGALQQGTQIIGWDPRSGEIRSWSFNSDGSFGDGIWSQSGEDWLIQSSQTLADGRAASGTYVLSRVNDDEVTLKLIGHDIEGQPQPASETVRMTRVASDDVAESSEPAESSESSETE